MRLRNITLKEFAEATRAGPIRESETQPRGIESTLAVGTETLKNHLCRFCYIIPIFLCLPSTNRHAVSSYQPILLSFICCKNFS